MITTITEHDFINAFVISRGVSGCPLSYKNNFSYEGLQELFAYYEQLENDTGEQIELDVVAICCEWTEYESKQEMLETYGMENREEIENNTTVLKVKNHYLVRNF